MAKYRGGVIGLGWPGLLYGLGERQGDWHADDIDRPTPDVDTHRKAHLYDHPGKESNSGSYSEALWDRPEVDLVAGCDRVPRRLEIFGDRYGIDALYTDAGEMLRKENLDIVAICTNVRGRSDLTCLAVEHGAKGIFTEKPMAHTLEEADRMVKACTDAGVPLCCGMTSTTHPSFAVAKELVNSGAIGDVVAMEAVVLAQHQNWSYFVDSEPAWVIGFGDKPRRETGTEAGSDEFLGRGMMVTADGLSVHFLFDEWSRPQGVPNLRIYGSAGEIAFSRSHKQWRLWQVIDTGAGEQRVEMPWPEPQMVSYGAAYGFADIVDCIEGRLDEPKNSGRRVATALEVEIALKLSSAQGGVRVDLPLQDRSLGLNYRHFR